VTLGLYLMTCLKAWSRAGFLLTVLSTAACAEGAKLVSDTGHGGVVIYPYKGEGGSLASSFRSEALRLIEQRCRDGYTVTREGEAKGRTRMVENAAGIEAITQKRWAIQFKCK
jgi:hypothetical protein